MFESISTPILALITAYIAWRHWRTDELKRRHDLYERRLKVYDAVSEFIENFETTDGVEFLRGVRESQFLFSREVSDYLDRIHKDWLKYIGIRRLFNSPDTKPDEPDFSKLSKEKGDIALRLKLQGPIATEKFAKEMTLSRI